MIRDNKVTNMISEKSQRMEDTRQRYSVKEIMYKLLR